MDCFRCKSIDLACGGTLAWSVPITQLAATGLPSVAVALGVVVIVGLSDRIGRLPPHQHGASWPLVLANVIFLGFFGAVVATSSWPIAVLTLFAVLVGAGIGFWGRRLDHRGLRLTYRHGWLLAVPILVVASVAIGLEGASSRNHLGRVHLRHGIARGQREVLGAWSGRRERVPPEL